MFMLRALGLAQPLPHPTVAYENHDELYWDGGPPC